MLWITPLAVSLYLSMIDFIRSNIGVRLSIIRFSFMVSTSILAPVFWDADHPRFRTGSNCTHRSLMAVAALKCWFLVAFSIAA